MTSKRYFNTEELTVMLEQNADFERADVFITPPDDGAGSEEDSGDEDDIGDINNLSGRQLRAQATAKLSFKNDFTNIGEDSDNECDISLSELRKELLLMSSKRNWSKTDLQPNFPPFVNPKEKQIIPSDLVELFFDAEVYDKFAKVRPLFNLLNTRFLEYAELAENLSIDESMVPYFGRHAAKQFIRGKPIRYGYKMWCLCEPLGYLIQFEPYQGKQNNRQNMDLGVGGSVVMNLLSKLPQNISFKIYGDRYFSSLKLGNRLQKLGYGYTGTIMANKIEKCPITSVKIMEKRDRGAYDFCTDTNTGITVTTWNDNRVVLTVSSCNIVEPIGQATRRQIVQVYLKKFGNSIVGGGRPKSSKEIESRVPIAIRYDRMDQWMVPAVTERHWSVFVKFHGAPVTAVCGNVEASSLAGDCPLASTVKAASTFVASESVIDALGDGGPVGASAAPSTAAIPSILTGDVAAPPTPPPPWTEAAAEAKAQ
ncbi:hypothetical protein CBL_20816 [Carabus blaptoides fortunei]